MVRALIVDDEADMRVLVSSIIKARNHDLFVAGEAASGEEGIAFWREHRPEVVILDQRMPGLTGLEAARRILAEAPAQAIILFSAYLDDDLVAEADAIGIRRCMSKAEAHTIPDELWSIDAAG